MASWKKIITDGASLTDIGNPAGTDRVLIQDASDNVIKYVDWSDISGGGGGGGGSFTEVADDTSPTLGGHLDTGGYQIRLDTNNVGIQGVTVSATTLAVLKVNSSNQVELGSTSAVTSSPGRTILGSNYHDDTNINTSTPGTYGVGADITEYGNSTSTSNGRVYYFNSTGGWTAGTPSAAAAQESLLAIATGTLSTRGMLLRGFVAVTVGNQSGNLTVGKPVFMSSNSSVTDVAPTGNGNYQRILGHAVSAKVIYFNPSQENIEL